MSNQSAAKGQRADRIEAIIRKAVADVRREMAGEMQIMLRHLVGGGKLVHLGTSPSMLIPSRPKRPMPSEQMRCKHVDPKTGDACQKRSGGPRFHYRCRDHRLPKRIAKRTKRALREARRAKRELEMQREADRIQRMAGR